MKLYTSVTKRLKLNVRNTCGLISTFVEVAGEELVGGFQLPSPLLTEEKVWKKEFPSDEFVILDASSVLELEKKPTTNPLSNSVSMLVIGWKFFVNLVGKSL